MQRYYLLTAGVVACFSSAITWYLVDPHSFVLYTNKHLQRQLVSSSSSSSNASNTIFCFYKFSLQWPPSTCTREPPKGRGLNCRGRVPAEFTIHGLWPDVSKDKPCTNLTPKSENEIIGDLQSIEEDLEQLWPNLKNSESKKDNQDFWKYEWKEHGKYSDYPEKPFDYFNSALKLRKSFHPAFQLTPGATNTVKEVADTIRGQVGAKPEIACSKSRVEKNTLLLWEVRLCYQKQTYAKPGVVQDCKKDFAGACENLKDRIKIPKSPSTPPASSTHEMPNHLAGIGSDFQAGTDEM